MGQIDIKEKHVEQIMLPSLNTVTHLLRNTPYCNNFKIMISPLIYGLILTTYKPILNKSNNEQKTPGDNNLYVGDVHTNSSHLNQQYYKTPEI